MQTIPQKYIGEKFGNWTVISYSHSIRYKAKTGYTYPKHFFNLKCVCGTEKKVALTSFLYGNSKGCAKCHFDGKSKHPLYTTWLAMRMRCTYPSHPAYDDYGRRGIKICDRWLGKKGFWNFVEDMGKKPTPEHTVDRINNDGNYEPKNCRWCTMKEQAGNRRPFKKANRRSYKKAS